MVAYLHDEGTFFSDARGPAGGINCVESPGYASGPGVTAELRNFLLASTKKLASFEEVKVNLPKSF